MGLQVSPPSGEDKGPEVPIGQEKWGCSTEVRNEPNKTQMKSFVLTKNNNGNNNNGKISINNALNIFKSVTQALFFYFEYTNP